MKIKEYLDNLKYCPNCGGELFLAYHDPDLLHCSKKQCLGIDHSFSGSHYSRIYLSKTSYVGISWEYQYVRWCNDNVHINYGTVWEEKLSKIEKMSYEEFLEFARRIEKLAKVLV